ncbi:MAG: hypothetical protein KAX49_14640 [Halanaerobiales bacterium]|nr:hypothetical protein [Halanaerobiales bacterium]
MQKGLQIKAMLARLEEEEKYIKKTIDEAKYYFEKLDSQPDSLQIHGDNKLEEDIGGKICRNN